MFQVGKAWLLRAEGVGKSVETNLNVSEVLRQVQEGEISPDEAVRLLESSTGSPPEPSVSTANEQTNVSGGEECSTATDLLSFGLGVAALGLLAPVAAGAFLARDLARKRHGEGNDKD